MFWGRYADIVSQSDSTDERVLKGQPTSWKIPTGIYNKSHLAKFL